MAERVFITHLNENVKQLIFCNLVQIIWNFNLQFTAWVLIETRIVILTVGVISVSILCISLSSCTIASMLVFRHFYTCFDNFIRTLIESSHPTLPKRYLRAIERDEQFTQTWSLFDLCVRYYCILRCVILVINNDFTQGKIPNETAKNKRWCS